MALMDQADGLDHWWHAYNLACSSVICGLEVP